MPMADERRHRNNVPAARSLRQPLTPTERLLWDRLRGRQFEQLKFRRQHPIGPFVLDFYCEERGFAIEVDGGVHQTPEQRRRDVARQMLLEELGITIVRVQAAQIEADLEGVLVSLRRALTPLSPLPEGAGE